MVIVYDENGCHNDYVDDPAAASAAAAADDDDDVDVVMMMLNGHVTQKRDHGSRILIRLKYIILYF
jgi:hypothetical protein